MLTLRPMTPRQAIDGMAVVMAGLGAVVMGDGEQGGGWRLSGEHQLGGLELLQLLQPGLFIAMVGSLLQGSCSAAVQQRPNGGHRDAVNKTLPKMECTLS